MPEPGANSEAVLVVIPTYNERATLGQVIERLHEADPAVDVLVVDDDSPDGTGRFADELAAEDQRISVLHRTEKAGLGAAYIAGFHVALERSYDVIVEMDADGSHPADRLPALLAASREADLVIGSRYVSGGRLVNWPKYRQLISRGANLYARLALGVQINDVTAGYRAYRAEVLKNLPLDEVESHGYCFQIDLSWRTVLAGFRVVEVPITFTEREQGKSKMNGEIMREAMIKIARWGFGHRVRQLRRLLEGRRG